MGSWIACASVSVWFRSKKRPWKDWKGIFGFDREIKREPWANIDSESIRARGIMMIIIIIIIVVVDDDDTYWVLLLGLLVLPPSISSLL